MNQVETTYQSDFSLKDIYIEEMSFQRKVGIKSALKLKFDFKTEFDCSDNAVNLRLDGEITEKNNLINARVVLVASFDCSFSDDISEEERESIKRKNSLAIVFPFIRSQFAMLTAQPGLAPIVIPAININAYIEDEGGE